jgi:hypothetical protein
MTPMRPTAAIRSFRRSRQRTSCGAVRSIPHLVDVSAFNSVLERWRIAKRARQSNSLSVARVDCELTPLLPRVESPNAGGRPADATVSAERGTPHDGARGITIHETIVMISSPRPFNNISMEVGPPEGVSGSWHSACMPPGETTSDAGTRHARLLKSGAPKPIKAVVGECRGVHL